MRREKGEPKSMMPVSGKGQLIKERGRERERGAGEKGKGSTFDACVSRDA